MKRTYDIMYKQFQLTSTEIDMKIQQQKQQSTTIGRTSREKLIKTDAILDDYQPKINLPNTIKIK